MLCEALPRALDVGALDVAMPKPELVASDILSGVIEEARFMAAIRSENIVSSSSGVDGIVKLDSCR